ncbi:MAG: NUDIX hydrolase [Chloroflexi bacterium]|nr:NUDIX hydrolase [Chloroflexota bacterium]
MSATPRVHHIVAAVIRRGDQVVLVRQQGPDDPGPVWALPGGVVEPGELLTEALRREVREETGLDVPGAGRLAYVAQLHNPSGHSRSPGELPGPGGQATAFVFELGDVDGELGAAGPNRFVSEARLWALASAIDELARLPFRFMCEPAVAYLRGDAAPGTTWLYRRQQDGTDALVAQLPGDSSTPLPPTPITRRPAPRRTGQIGPEEGRQRAIVVLGCMILLAALVVLIVVGVVTLLHRG